MANTTNEIPILTAGEDARYTAVLASNVKLPGGTMVSQLTANGYLVPTTTASSGPAVGVMPWTVDASGGAAGSVRATCMQGVFRFKNDVANPIDESLALGTPIYAVDNWTVSDVGTVLAGTFQGLDSDGMVRVKIALEPPVIHPEGGGGGGGGD
jgi:hypothetical protein